MKLANLVQKGMSAQVFVAAFSAFLKQEQEEGCRWDLAYVGALEGQRLTVVKLSYRMKSRDIEATLILDYTPELHRLLCCGLKKNGWAIRPFDNGKGFLAFRDDSCQMRSFQSANSLPPLVHTEGSNA